MKRIALAYLLGLMLLACKQTGPSNQPEEKGFSFVFMTDIHLTTERNATEGFLQAIDSVNALKPDFVLTGGDLIMDALAENYASSDSAYKLYAKTIQNFNMPVYNTMGNHEVFGLYERSGIDPTHEEYGKKLYENRLHKRYYSFDFNDWHFVVLDGIGFTDERRYYGYIDSTQIEWLKADLNKVGNKPIAVSTHIPLISVGSQIMQDPTQGMSKGSVVTNANVVRGVLEQYNTKLVLQGHLHFLEDIEYNGIHYITGGAVSAQWWQGPRFGMKEGFLKIDVKGEDFEWEYIDFGWQVKDAS